MNHHPSHIPVRKSPTAAVLLAAIVLVLHPAAAQDVNLDDLMNDANQPAIDALADLTEDMDKAKDERDFQGLATSMLGNLRHWNNVDANLYTPTEQIRRRQRGLPVADTNAAWRFNRSSGLVEPADGVRPGPVWALLRVPSNGTYRVWLRHQTDRVAGRRFHLKIGDRPALVFNDFKLTMDASKAQEKRLPIRFEDEAVRATFPKAACWVWEFRDVPLTAGDTRFELMPEAGSLGFTHIFISQSLRFVPRLGQEHADNLSKVFLRFRVNDSAPKTFTFSQASFGYHWKFLPEGAFFEAWGMGMGNRKYKDSGPHTSPSATDGGKTFKTGEWSDWLDVSHASIWKGPWATGNLRFDTVSEGTCDVELAWHPHPGARLRSIRIPIEEGRTMFCMPLAEAGRGEGVLPDSEGREGVWGFYKPSFIDWFKSTAEFQETYAGYARQAREKLGLTGKTWKVHPGIRFSSTTEGLPSERRVLAGIQVSLGINTIRDLPPADCEAVGIAPFMSIRSASHTCDPADPAHVVRNDLSVQAGLQAHLAAYPGKPEYAGITCVGDEIGLICNAYKANQSPECLSRFREYLRQVLLAEGADATTFFGVPSVNDLVLTEDGLPERPGLYERRLYSHSHKFREVLTADYYRPMTEAVARYVPHVPVYANYTPAPLRQGSMTMNGGGWFHNLRLRGLSLAWGEDWSYRVGSMTGHEIVSFFAALVECAAREHNLPAGFYNVPYCGRADTNIFSALARRIRMIHIFSFGPSYDGTGLEGNWSDSPVAYLEIMRATYAISLIDKLVAEGVQAPRRTAVLYNRDQERMYNGEYGEQAERTSTFAALTCAHRNADIILNEDLTPRHLAAYKVLHLNGFCIPRKAVPVLDAWVREGNLLVLGAHCGAEDEYRTPMPEMDTLRGARTRLASPPSGPFQPQYMTERLKPLGTVTVHESDLTPALAPGNIYGVRAPLEPTTAVPVAAFEDGTCAGTLNAVGKGHVLSWGFQPGLFFKGEASGLSNFTDERLALFEKPVRHTAGEAELVIGAPQIELNRFDLDGQTGLMVNNFLRYDWKPDLPPTKIRLKLDRPVGEVVSAFHGTLAARQSDGWLEIDYSVPETIDTLLIK